MTCIKLTQCYMSVIEAPIYIPTFWQGLQCYTTGKEGKSDDPISAELHSFKISRCFRICSPPERVVQRNQ